jgi:N-methylhydantoinase A
MLRVGIDVGGTFTDVAALDSETGETLSLKIPSTPREPERGVLAAFDAALKVCGRDASAVEFLGLSTTIATNALLGQIGLELPRVAMVTTHGFRDVIEIGRQNRSAIYDLFVQRPVPLVARKDRLTVRERVGAGGEIVAALDEVSLARACEQLRALDGVGAVAVCLLNAYANDAHERRVAEAVAEALPHAAVVASSQIDPEYREYERFSTAVVNAALVPIVARYLERVSAALRERGARVPIYVMQSDGGLASAQRAASHPAATIESGPAGGAIAAAALGRRIGVQRLLSFDMGGTTAKAGAIVDGVAQVTSEFEAAGRTHSGRAVKGSGYPVRFPFVDLAEVSAGGGTIAWLDDAGALRVGPLSAGADPGPACYGESYFATVTDANIVLGRLNDRALLGGTFPIDAVRSHAAVSALAKPLGLSVAATAAGIVTLVDAQMAKALRIVTLERGLDPRDFTLAAFGGGGPLHACALADDLGIARILIPARPGVFSAEGLLDAQLHERFTAPLMRMLDELDDADLERILNVWEAQARESLRAQGACGDAIRFRRELDARYAGQSFELTIAYDGSRDAAAGAFHDAHRARYGYDAANERIEVVNARLTATGTLPSAQRAAKRYRQRAAPSPVAKRPLWLGKQLLEKPVYAREQLAEGQTVRGPAIVEQYDATTYVAPGWSLHVREELLVLEREGAAA